MSPVLAPMSDLSMIQLKVDRTFTGTQNIIGMYGERARGDSKVIIKEFVCMSGCRMMVVDGHGQTTPSSGLSASVLSTLEKHRLPPI